VDIPWAGMTGATGPPAIGHRRPDPRTILAVVNVISSRVSMTAEQPHKQTFTNGKDTAYDVIDDDGNQLVSEAIMESSQRA
jgi:hypothetical protein